jgi:mannose-6-phosphate isomerase-like protein (cupin superfamily)
MPSIAHPSPINLTEAAGRMPWSEVEQALRVHARYDGAALEIRGLEYAADGHPDEGLHDTVYFVVASYGVLRCGETAIEFTAGDVIFVPKDCPHHFEQLDGKIRIWRLLLASAKAQD